jgi:hypothetical protein
VLENIKIEHMHSLNKPCFCGSGKKYKRCHLNKKHKNVIKVKSNRNVNTAIDFLTSPKVIIDSKPNTFNNLRFVKNIENLPSEIKDEVISKTLEFNPKIGDCLPLSMFLTSSIENVKLEIGLFKTKNVGIGFQNQNPQKDKWYEYGIWGKKVVFIDEYEDKWGIHCWNSYKGIHFDSLKDFVFKIEEPNEWIKYKKIQTVNFIPNNNSEVEFVKNVVLRRAA